MGTMDSVKAFAWGSPLRKIVSSVTLVAGCVTAVASAEPIVEPYWYAHRGYVRSYVKDAGQKVQTAQIESQRVIRDIQVEQAEGKRDQVEDNLLKWKVEEGKATDPQAKQLISDRIRELENTRRKLESQIKTLNKVKSDEE